MVKLGISKKNNGRDWSNFSMDEKIDFFTVRKVESAGYNFGHPDFQKMFLIYRNRFDKMTEHEAEEIFSAVKPFAIPSEISEYIWKGRQVAKWAAYGRVLHDNQQLVKDTANSSSILYKVTRWLKS